MKWQPIIFFIWNVISNIFFYWVAKTQSKEDIENLKDKYERQIQHLKKIYRNK